MRNLSFFLLSVGLFATACTSGSPESTEADPLAPSILEATPTPTDETPPAELEVTELPAEEEGVLVNQYDLDPGDCFNTYAAPSVDLEVLPTTRVVDCNDPHESEVYYQHNLPGGPDEAYPGEDEIRRAAEQRCYREFEGFTASVYEVSALEIGVIHPTLETWTGPGLHREITCYVFAASGGALQGGSMANAGI
jgi:hypothetical protein